MTPATPRARRSWLAPLFALLLTACGSATPPLPPLDPSAVVLAFGDSLTFGTGASPGESYPAQLERLIGRKVVAQGVPGEVSAQGLARLPGVLEATAPRLLVLCHGGNDLLRKLPESEAAANVRAMVRLAREKGIAVVLIGVPRPGISPSPAAFYAAIAEEFAVPYEGSILKTVLTDNELKSDWIHPNAKGYARVAEAVAGLLKNAKALP
jgi:acyl-CoA thioesterase-1